MPTTSLDFDELNRAAREAESSGVPKEVVEKWYDDTLRDNGLHVVPQYDPSTDKSPLDSRTVQPSALNKAYPVPDKPAPKRAPDFLSQVPVEGPVPGGARSSHQHPEFDSGLMDYGTDVADTAFSGFNRVGSGLLSSLGSLAEYGGDQGLADDIQHGADYLSDVATKYQPTERDSENRHWTNVGGSFLPMAVAAPLGPLGLGAYALGEGVNAGKESLRAGNSVAKASGVAGITGGEYGLLSSLPTSVGKGILTRMATGVAGNIGIDISGSEARNALNPDSLQEDPLNPERLLIDAGFGLLGGLHKPADKAIPRPKPIIKTGDSAFDAGANSVSSAAKPSPRQGDLLNDTPYGMDMFSRQPVEASNIESRRVTAERGLSGYEAQRTPDEQAALERDYLLDQQAKTEAQAEPSPTNPAIQEAFRRAGVEPANGPLFRPSEIRTNEEKAPTQGDLPNLEPAPEQQSLFPQDKTPTKEEPLDVPGVMQEEPLVDIGSKSPESEDTRTVHDILNESSESSGVGPDEKINIPEDVRGISVVNGKLRIRVKNGKLRAPADIGTLLPIVDKDVSNQDIAIHSDINSTPNVLEYSRKMLQNTDLPGPVEDAMSVVLDNPVTRSKLAKSFIQSISPKDLMDPATPARAHTVGVAGYPVEGLAHGNQIYIRGAGFKGNGLKPHVIAHEILHLATNSVIEGVESGAIKDPVVVGAHSKLSDLREALIASKAKGKEIPFAVDHGLTNIKELVSVFRTDKAAREWMNSHNENGHKVPLLRSIGRKIKDAWHKMLNVKTHKQRTALDTLQEQSDILLGHTGDNEPRPDWMGEEASFSRGGSGTRTTNEQEESRIFGSKAWGAVRRVMASGGTHRPVEEIKRSVLGAKAGATLLDNYNLNILKSAMDSGHLSSDDLGSVITKKHGWANIVKSLNKDNPRAARALGDLDLTRTQNGNKLATEALRNPKLGEKGKAVAAEYLKNANSFLTRTYQYLRKSQLGTPITEVRRKRAIGLIGKLEKSPDLKLGKSDVDLVNDYKSLRQWASDVYLPTDERLSGYGPESIKAMYRYFTGEDPVEITRNVDSNKDKHNLLLEVVRGKVHSVGNRDQFLDNFIKAASSKGESNKLTKIYFSNVRLTSDVMSTRKAVPPPIRKWWGEVKDPATNLAMTMAVQADHIAQLQLQNDIRERGLTSGWLTEAEDHAVMTKKIEGPSMGPLAGLNTSPRVHLALQSILDSSPASGSFAEAVVADTTGQTTAQWMANRAITMGAVMNQSAKFASVVLSPPQFAINLAGSPLQLMSNGNLHPINTPRYAYYGIEGVLNAINSARREGVIGGPEAMSRQLEYVRGNLLEYSQIHELQSSASLGNILKRLDKSDLRVHLKEADRSLGSRTAEGHKLAMTNIEDASKIVKTVLGESYGSADLWTKIANYHMEKDHLAEYYKAIGKDKTPEEIQAEAAERTNRTNITPSRAPWIARFGDKAGIANFMTYYWEVNRSAAHSVLLGLQDISTGHPIKIRHGAARVAGAIGTLTIGNTLMAGLDKAILTSMGMIGVDNDDKKAREKYVKSDPYYAGTDPDFYKDPDSGQEYISDPGFQNPYGSLTQTLSPLIHAVADPKNAGKHLEESWQATTNLVIRNAWLRGAYRALEGKKPIIDRMDPEAGDSIKAFYANRLGMSPDAGDVATNLLWGFMPGGGKYAIRAATDAKSAGNPKGAVAMLGGIGIMPFDVGKDLSSFVGGSLQGTVNDAKASYLDLLKLQADVDQPIVEDKFRDGLTNVALAYKKAEAAIGAGRAQGLSDKVIATKLKRSGLSTVAIQSVMSNYPYVTQLMAGELVDNASKQLIDNLGDKEKSKAIISRAKVNSAAIAALLQKYQFTTADEIINGEF